MEWPIQEVASNAGVTSRTLRHYDNIGLLKPSSLGDGGTRYYDANALMRLQRILLLRQLGLGLADVEEILDGTVDEVAALQEHVRPLSEERSHIDQQIEAVHATIRSLQDGSSIRIESLFQGLSHSRYREEVAEQWGQNTAQLAESWWKDLKEHGQRAFLGQHQQLQSDYDAALAMGHDPAADHVQGIAHRHYLWIASAWQNVHLDAAALKSLADMYVDDPRLAENYTRISPTGAEFVRDALYAYADNRLA